MGSGYVLSDEVVNLESQLKELEFQRMFSNKMDPNDAFGMGVHAADHTSEGSVSRESCCQAVMCMVECCSCPVTKAALIECCQAIMSGEYDQ